MKESFPQAELIPITNDLQIELKTADAENQSPEIIGLVFPVYMMKPPHIIMNFLRKLPPADYVYAIATCGMNPGNTLTVLKNALLKRGMTLSAGYIIPLVTSFVFLPNIKTKKGVEKSFKKAEAKTQMIAANIHNQALHFDKETPKIIQKPLSGLMFNPIYKHIPSLDKAFKVRSKKCISCGTCRDVCPVRNITMGVQPVFHHHCEMCFSCINWCPQKAINWTIATRGRRRYHCTDISKDDVIAKRYYRLKKE
jgi:ferredoxin